MKKEQLIQACEAFVEDKLATVQRAIDDLEAALKLETKCSMGDKYETGRAMLHLEFEKLAGQYEEFKKLRKTVRMIPSGKTSKVGFGSIVKTSQANYFISVPAGIIEADGEKFFAVGAGAPVARALLEKEAGSSIVFNGREIHIEAVT
ncbi:transcription elongation factor [Salinimicrobium oceani]|uniref:Transcription elongation factor n=1 Tax=Salinimicrobium oceani TaxID=2722702 RepID=A0ABX1D010_9FLAO|nr:transcription elongation factor [Salinimicrobium oceani]NJW53840.1 transcription elongation factor [Salinimicrobium oceani]